MEIVLKVSKSEVLHEVAQTTEYTGSKMDDDANAYERISTVDEDNSELQRFWDESRAEIAKMFMKILEGKLLGQLIGQHVSKKKTISRGLGWKLHHKQRKHSLENGPRLVK